MSSLDLTETQSYTKLTST